MSLRSAIAAIPGVRRVAAAVRRIPRSPAEFAERILRRFDPPELNGVSDAPQSFAIRKDIIGLELANRISRRKMIDPDSDVVVSATTHGKRIHRVHVAIESVARGTVRPGRYVLWLDDPTLMTKLPRTLKRLRRRGLDIILVPAGYRVHTKYFPYVESIDHHEKRLVTSEDDIVFPPEWLQTLLDGSDRHPDCVVSYRAHEVTFVGGEIAPYDDWRPCRSTTPSFRHFGTNVSGQVYPAAFLNFVKGEGTRFQEVAPMNDDIWLHHLAVKSGTRTVQVLPEPQLFPWVPGTQASGLFWTNVLGGENDLQIRRAYDAAEIDRMLAEPSAE